MEDSCNHEAASKPANAFDTLDAPSTNKPELPQTPPAAALVPLSMSTFLDSQVLAQYEAQFCSADCSLAGSAMRQQEPLLSMLQQVAPRGTWPIEPDLIPLISEAKQQQQQQLWGQQHHQQQQQQMNTEEEQLQQHQQQQQMHTEEKQQQGQQQMELDEQQQQQQQQKIDIIEQQQHKPGGMHEKNLQQDQQVEAQQKDGDPAKSGCQVQANHSQEPELETMQQLQQEEQGLGEELPVGMGAQLPADRIVGIDGAITGGGAGSDAGGPAQVAAAQKPQQSAADLSGPFSLASYIARDVTAPSSGVDLLLGAGPEQELDHEDVPLPSYLQKYLGGATTRGEYEGPMDEP